MRLHRLELQAFGPFPGREAVDVDRLAAQGLFLLHGPTGAGKSSVLDAVCFALYGRVPGARGGGSRLRSDHAPVDLPPQVLVEIGVGGRRFEVTRSPAWERPKKRGTGTTTEPAKTLLREQVDGQWVPLSSRNDEASQLLTDVLGMGLEQFTKVVLLPQGEFAAFLRAPAEERRPLLQRLFGTDRFAAVEQWLAEQRRDLGRRVDEVDASLDRLLARAHQVRGQLPASAAVDEPADPVDPVGWCQAATAWALSVTHGRRDEHAVAVTTRDAARTEHDCLADQVKRADRLRAALAEQAALADAGTAAADAETRLERARAAASIAGDLRGAASAVSELERVEAQLGDAHRLVETMGLAAEAASSELVTDARRLREEHGRLAELLDLEERARQLHEQRRVLAGDHEAAIARRSTADAELARLVVERTAHTETAERLRPVAAGLADADHALHEAETVLAAARRRDELHERVTALRDRLQPATDQSQGARQHWLDLREQRLAGMAAELALDLEPGLPCAVCGSTAHPAPAQRADGHVTADAEQAAHEEFQRLEAARGEIEAELTAVRQDLAVADRLSAGRDRSTAEADRRAAAQAATTARTAAADLGHTQQAIEAAAVARDELLAARGQAAEQEAALVTELAGVDRSLAELTQRLAAGRGDHDTVADRRERLHRSAEALESLASMQDRRSAAAGAAARAAVAAEAAATHAGFDSPAHARAAALPDAEVRALTAAVRQHADAWAAVQGRLADDDLALAATEQQTRTADGVTDEDLQARCVAAARTLAASEQAVQDTAAALAVAQGAAEALQLLTEQVSAEVAAAAPLRERHRVVDDLARCAEGTGGGNTLRMRLSSYVLAARLEQVAAAATVRLDDMSGGRFALVHSDAAERGGRRSGLGLEVVDHWTGHQRDTASLSGGESFLASLALALGLADVVQAEAGGAAIETLFVDEGFGTLDAEALEDVMAVLDGLRDGGRSVGLISHVAELRQRIPARLEVVKSRTGSHLRIGCGAA